MEPHEIQIQQQAVFTLGNAALLEDETTAFFCSTKVPGDAILKIFDWANSLRGKNLTIISGFHTPMEKEVWRILQRDPSQKLIHVVARSLPKRHPADWADLFEAERLLILSPFPQSLSRATRASCETRNTFTAGIANQIILGYADPQSSLQHLGDLFRQPTVLVKSS